VKQYLDATVYYQQRNFTHDEFLAAIRAQSQLLPNGGLAILAELAASDKCMIGVLNNEARATNEYRFEHFGLWNHLEVAFSSCYLGLRKPGPAIYRRALDILGKPADRILFIDDRAENVAAAAASGMKTIQFQGADSLRHELEKLEVL
jgi:putative hydrolase of the HAD superfamily